MEAEPPFLDARHLRSRKAAVVAQPDLVSSSLSLIRSNLSTTELFSRSRSFRSQWGKPRELAISRSFSLNSAILALNSACEALTGGRLATIREAVGCK